MLTEATLISLIGAQESQFLERKKALPNRAELRKTLCAFANSTPEGQYSALLLGIADNGEVVGVEPTGADSMQKTIIEVGQKDCYPPIHVVPQPFQHNGKTLIFIIVQPSKNKPHFTGHSYVRVGPTSCEADEVQFNDLIASRIEKAGRILHEKEKGATVSIQWTIGYPIGPDQLPHNARDYEILRCDPFYLELRDQSTGNLLVVMWDQIQITRDIAKRRLRLLIAGWSYRDCST